MGDSIVCPHCRFLLLVTADGGGRQMQCPRCRESFVSDVPTKADIAGSGPAATTVPREPTSAASLESAEGKHARPLQTPFKPGGYLALTLKIALALHPLLFLAMLVSGYWHHHLGERMLLRLQGRALQYDSGIALLGTVYLGVTFVCSILFLVWFHRVHVNLRPLGAIDLRFTPGWAVMGWFVPFLNLFRPLQIAQEIWRNSNPAGEDWDEARSAPANSTLLRIWWVAWIFSGLLSQFAFVSASAPQTAEALDSVARAEMITSASTAVAALLALSVVVVIEDRQRRRAQHLDLLGRDGVPYP